MTNPYFRWFHPDVTTPQSLPFRLTQVPMLCERCNERIDAEAGWCNFLVLQPSVRIVTVCFACNTRRSRARYKLRARLAHDIAADNL